MESDPRAFAALRRRRIGVLYGGWSAERPISIKSGRAVLAALRRRGLRPVGVDVDPGVARALRAKKIDLVFPALHGPFGEDGRLQGLLDMMGVPYAGCGVRASALAMHKPSAKALWRLAGLSTPSWSLRRRGEAGLPDFALPWVVKPASQGSALGVTIVKRRVQWAAALKAAWRLDEEALVESFIPGTEVTVGLLDGRALPVVEIVPRNAFYDFDAKYSPGGSRHIVPARLPRRALDAAAGLSLRAFDCLGGRHFGRVDMIVSPRGAPTLLEVNTLPGMTDVSLLPDAARAAGLSFDDLVVKILTLALRDARG